MSSNFDLIDVLYKSLQKDFEWCHSPNEFKEIELPRIKV